MEHSAQNKEATASSSGANASRPFAFSDLFGPPLGIASIDTSLDIDAFLNSPAPATVDPTLGSKGETSQEETPDIESEDVQNILDLTLTETSMDDLRAASDIPNELAANCEDEMSCDNSDLPRKEDDHMEISPETVSSS